MVLSRITMWKIESHQNTWPSREVVMVGADDLARLEMKRRDAAGVCTFKNLSQTESSTHCPLAVKCSLQPSLVKATRLAFAGTVHTGTEYIPWRCDMGTGGKNGEWWGGGKSSHAGVWPIPPAGTSGVYSACKYGLDGG